MANKHKYSTFVLIIFIGLFFITIFASGIDSKELDELCDLDDHILYRYNGTWGCAFMNDITINYTINNITNVWFNASGIQGEYWVNTTGDTMTGDLHMSDGTIDDLTNISFNNAAGGGARQIYQGGVLFLIIDSTFLRLDSTRHDFYNDDADVSLYLDGGDSSGTIKWLEDEGILEYQRSDGGDLSFLYTGTGGAADGEMNWSVGKDRFEFYDEIWSGSNVTGTTLHSNEFYLNNTNLTVSFTNDNVYMQTRNQDTSYDFEIREWERQGQPNYFTFDIMRDWTGTSLIAGPAILFKFNDQANYQGGSVNFAPLFNLQYTKPTDVWSTSTATPFGSLFLLDMDDKGNYSGWNNKYYNLFDFNTAPQIEHNRTGNVTLHYTNFHEDTYASGTKYGTGHVEVRKKFIDYYPTALVTDSELFEEIGRNIYGSHVEDFINYHPSFTSFGSGGNVDLDFIYYNPTLSGATLNIIRNNIIRATSGDIVLESSDSDITIGGISVCLEDGTNCPGNFTLNNETAIQGIDPTDKTFNVLYENNNDSSMMIYGSFFINQSQSTSSNQMVSIKVDDVEVQRIGLDNDCTGSCLSGSDPTDVWHFPYSFMVLGGQNYTLNTTSDDSYFDLLHINEVRL